MPAWSRQAIEAIYQAGIVQGRPDGTFDPAGRMTRAEMAKVLLKTLQLVNLYN
jgi:hypothetical protein